MQETRLSTLEDGWIKGIRGKVCDYHENIITNVALLSAVSTTFVAFLENCSII